MKNIIKKATIHFAEGFEEIEAITIVDILRRAEIDTIMVSITKRRMVTGSHNITITCDAIFEDINYDEIDIIILPGGMPGATNLNAHDGLKKQIKKFHSADKMLGAICAAPLVFGSMGILNGVEAVSYPGFEKYLNGAKIKDNLVVKSGKITTAKGPGAAIPFALKLVEQIKGTDAAKKISDDLIASTS